MLLKKLIDFKVLIDINLILRRVLKNLKIAGPIEFKEFIENKINMRPIV